MFFKVKEDITEYLEYEEIVKLIRRNTFETNSSSTHALVIISKDDYKAWQENKKVLNLYSGTVEDLSEQDKETILERK